MPLPDSVPTTLLGEVLGMVREAQRAVGEPDVWVRRLLERLIEVTDSDSGVVAEEIVSGGGGQPRVTWYVDAGWSDQARLHLLRYLRDGGLDDPMTLAMHQVVQRHPGEAVLTRRRDDLLIDANWHNSEHFLQYRKPAGVDACLYSSQKLPTPGWLATLQLYRRVGRPGYTTQERELLGLIHRGIDWLFERRTPAAARLGEDLSPRLRDVLHLLLSGAAPKEIAYRLDLSDHTVRGYIKQIYKQVEVSGRGELMSRFAQEVANRPIDFQI